LISKRLVANFVLLIGLLSAASRQPLFAQRPGPGGASLQNAGLTVNVRYPDGSEFDRGAIVTVYVPDGGVLETPTMRSGQAEFDGVSPGRYTVEVSAPGYQKLTETVEVPTTGQHGVAYLVLKPEAGGNGASKADQPPVLAPSAQKEFNKALEALRANQPEQARKHLDKIFRAAPGNPDVNYTWGMYYAELQDWAKAKSFWEKAVQIYPAHAFSLAALAQTLMQEGDLPAAIGYLGRAVAAAPSSYRFEELLARAYLDHEEYESATKHAEHAIELGKERAVLAQLILAKALLKQGGRARAEKTLETLLAAQPSGAISEEAARTLAEARAPATPASAPTAGAKGPDQRKPAIAEELIPEPKWMPPDVDEAVPAVEAGVACPLNEVEEESGKRVREFVNAVNRITATEVLEHETVDRYGFASRRETRNYTYVGSVQEERPGNYNVEEYRNGTMGLDVFPAHLATLGLTTLVMIFHPAYRDEYEFTCEGLSRWHGAPAWQVHFRQRPDQPARLREYRVNNQPFAVSLRGRAWISAETYQVLSLETDLVAPISPIRLKAEHIAIEYMAVQFHEYREELWLPQSAEIFVDFEGRRVHRRHHFSNYLLFSVHDKQKISTPSVKADSGPGSLPQDNF
jgi:tetratricopeptide (TPR) repeat protein